MLEADRLPAGSDELFIYQQIVHVDPNNPDDVIGSTRTTGWYVTSGFSFSIDTGKYDTASVAGTNIPVQRCSYDGNGNLRGCTNTTINASATWTGHGMMSHTNSTWHFNCQTTGGTYQTVSGHSGGKYRNATATATVGSLTQGTNAQQAYAVLGTYHDAEVSVIGGNC
jgi:hypothetical protein